MSLSAELASVVGAEHVLVDPDLTASYETDWTGRFSGRCLAVVRPADAEQVGAVLVSCAREGVPVVVQGGNTGLVGGGVPAGGEVLLSTARLRELAPVDVTARQVTVGAGLPLSVLQAHVRAHGLDLGVDLGSRDSASVGGMVATNAGGGRVLRHGPMRSQLAGVEAVLADGRVVSRLGGLVKDSTGYDLGALLCGSEGTLAVLTRVRLHLVQVPTQRTVLLVGVADVAAALRTLTGLRDRLDSMEAAELFTADGLALVRERTGLPAPLRESHGCYLLVECAGGSAGPDVRAAVLAALTAAADVEDAVVVSESSGRDGLWRYREAHTESIAAVGVPVKLDVAVPLSALAGFVAELPGLVRRVAPSARVIVFGHLAEGNLHVNVLGAGGVEREVSDAVLRRVAGLDGSISAEHGVGRAKVEWLGLTRSPAEIAAMTAIKRALDPGWLLAPGVLLPAPAGLRAQRWRG